MLRRVARRRFDDAVRQAVCRHLLAGSIAIAANTCVWAQDLENGQAEFLSKCAECHGVDGKGEGSKSSKLAMRPADLTLLAKNNNGVFSPDAVAEAIDGRRAARPHRGSAMPIWGCRHGPPPGPNRKAHQAQPIDTWLDLPCDPEDVIRKRIADIVAYLGRIQQK
jgi:hypothetical protein